MSDPNQPTSSDSRPGEGPGGRLGAPGVSRHSKNGMTAREWKASLTPEQRALWKRQRREARRLRLRRHGRRAYIRSAYSLPSLATLGNVVCGFGSMYVASLSSAGSDHWTAFFKNNHYVVAAYLIFLAMLWDALDGRLARFTRHTTDFGGQLDSLADVISFGCAPAFLALQVFKDYHLNVYHWDLSPIISRLIWAFGALYVSCAAIRLARFNVSNEHGEQHHFSFLGLPSPGAGGVVAAFILMQQDLAVESTHWNDHPNVAGLFRTLALIAIWLLPLVLAGCGLLMVSTIRYPHIVNRYLRGRQSLQRLVLALGLVLALIVAHRYTLGVCMIIYALWGALGTLWLKLRPRKAIAATPAALPPSTPAP